MNPCKSGTHLWQWHSTNFPNLVKHILQFVNVLIAMNQLKLSWVFGFKLQTIEAR